MNPEHSSNSLENKLMMIIYDSLSPCGRAIFNSAFFKQDLVNLEEFFWRSDVCTEDDFEITEE